MRKFHGMFRVYTEEKLIPWASGMLLALLLITLLVVPTMPTHTINLLYSVMFTGIFLCAAFALRRYRQRLISGAIVLTIIMWSTMALQYEGLRMAVRGFQILFFFFLVVGLIRQISTNDTVTRGVIVDAITGYLLLGFALGLGVNVITVLDPGAYNTPADPETTVYPVRNYLYYTFITYTTTGYGDIVPLSHTARSMAILIGVSGQLYVATIIALLVGKYASQKERSSNI
jgi:hypothetical protein